MHLFGLSLLEVDETKREVGRWIWFFAVVVGVTAFEVKQQQDTHF